MNYKAITESNLLRIAYPERFPACSSVVYIFVSRQKSLRDMQP